MRRRRKVGRLKWTAARWIRRVLLIVLAGVVVLLAGILILRIGRRGPEEKPAEETGSPRDNVNVMENVQFFQFKGDKGKIEARGDRNVPAGEGFFRLEGNVEIVDHGRKGGREIRIKGDSLTYDKDWRKFTFQGRIKIDFEGFHLEASDFMYDRVREEMSTGSGVVVSSPTFKASSRRLIFYTEGEEAVFEDDVRVSARISLTPDVPLVLTAWKFNFGFQRRSGNAEGNLRLEHGSSTGAADAAYLELFTDTDDLRLVELKGNVRLHVEEKAAAPAAASPAAPAAEKPAGGAGTPASLRSELKLSDSLGQDVEASSVRIFAYPEGSALERLELSGGAVVRFRFGSGAATGIGGEAVRMDFDRAGDLTALGAGGGAWIESRGPDQELLHTLGGDAIRYFGDKGLMAVARSAKSKARLAGPTSEVQADAITIHVEQDDFEAEGGVQMRSQGEPGGAAPGGSSGKGFFAADRPIFSQSESLRYSGESRRFSLTDPARPVRAWQEDKVLTAMEITIVEDGAEVAASGTVRSIFPHKAADGTLRLIEIGAARMRYDRAAGRVVYEGGCTLSTGVASLTCETITVEPGAESGEVRTMRADRSKTAPVGIVMGDRTAVGDLAVYDIDQDTIVVTGRPVLKEKDTGEVRGDKLTFHLADGRIQVQERASAVIRS